MKVPIRILAGSTVLGGMTLLMFVAPVSPPPRAEARLGATPICAPTARRAPDWMDRVRPTLERMRLRTGGEDLERLLVTVDDVATRFGLDPVAVLGVILVESRFDADAVSPRGAIGLMQVRADTGREVAEHLGIPWTSDDLLFDPETNVLIGACYLSRLVRRFGDLDVALAAFHAGPGRIEAIGGPASSEYSSRVWDAIVRLRVRPLA